MKFCTNCGAEIADGSKFCSNCGAKMEETINTAASFGEIDIKYEEDTESQSVYEETFSGDVNDVNSTLENSYNDTPAQELDIHYEEEETFGGKEVFVVPQPQHYEMNSVKEAENGNIGFSIASMVCGILSLVCCCLTWFSLLLGIGAIALGVISLKGKYGGRGMAIAGVICGGIGVAIWLVLTVMGGAAGLFGDLLEF